MPIYDLSAAQLKELRGPDRAEPADFDSFWAETLELVRNFPLDVHLEPVETGLVTVHTSDLTFTGWGGQRIHAWLIQPAEVEKRNGGCVVEYVGYGGGRGLPHEWLTWPSAGYTYLVMDARGQGSGYRTGITPDHGQNGQPQVPGFLTQGIESPQTYYYRRLYSDAVRAVEAARTLDGIDPNRVAVAGTSQGGGLAIAAAALADNVQALITAVPFLCGFREAAEVAPEGPFTELASYCAQRPGEIDQVFQTLSYFDCVNLARRATAPALWAVALMDRLVPPSTVLAAHRNYGGPARLSVHPFAGHEDARGEQARDGLDFLDDVRINQLTTKGVSQ